MFAVTFPDGTSRTFEDARGYRVDKRNTLFVVGPHFSTLAAYPFGSWSYVSQSPRAQD